MRRQSLGVVVSWILVVGVLPLVALGIDVGQADAAAGLEPTIVFANGGPPNPGSFENTECSDTGGGWVCDPVEGINARRNLDVAAADLNTDGHLDVVFAVDGPTGPSNRVCIGDGVGGWSCSDVDGTTESYSVAIGDVDADADLDLVFANGASGANRTCLNDGAGAFPSCFDATSPGNLGNSTDVALAYIDDDSILDVLFANSQTPASYVALGVGDGMFTGLVPMEAGHDTNAVAVADIDGDGTLDAVFANNGPNPLRICWDLATIQSTGTPTCADATTLDRSSADVTAADIDGDGDIDIVAADAQGNAVCVNESGALDCRETLYGSTASSPSAREVELGDIDSDGDVDAVVAVAGVNQVCRNDGSGLSVGNDPFTCEDVTTVSDDSHGVAIASDARPDTDGDGITDVADLDDDGDGQLDSHEIACGSDPLSAASMSADSDADGIPDCVDDNDSEFFPGVVFNNQGGGADTRVCEGFGNGSFDCRFLDAAVSGRRVAVADLDGDGFEDIVLARAGNSTNRFCLSDGVGGYTCNDISPDLLASEGIDIGDLDGDGVPDLAVGANPTNKLCFAEVDGSGAFAAGFTCTDYQSPADTSESGTGVLVADVDFDGDQDFVFANFGGSASKSCYGDGTGSFDCRIIVHPQEGIRDLGVGDFDGDGDLDAVVAVQSSANRLFRNPDDGSPWAAPNIDADNRADAGVGGGDFNEDGTPDAVYAVLNEPNKICLGVGDGTFESCMDVRTEENNRSWDVAVADFDDDDHLDVVFANENQPNTFCSGNGDGTFDACTSVGTEAEDTRGVAVIHVPATADTTPPVITAPTPGPTEATGPDGAAVTFAVTATDDVDGAVPVSCDATSGDTFPLGTTTVTCDASDTAGNTAQATFDVEVVDTTPPVITVSDDVTVASTHPSGAIVTYDPEPIATDVAGTAIVTCSPPSGALFPYGTTTVTCVAEDEQGLTAMESLDVTIEELVGLSDVTGPELVGVSVAGSPVDVSGSPGSVVVTFDVTDDLSGVAGASLSLVSPSGSLIGRASSAPGLLSDSVSITVPIPQFAEAGTWDFGLVLLRDKAGNYRHVDPGDLGFPDSIEVVGLSDVTGPELVGVSVAGSPVDVSGSPGSVVVTFDVTDDLSGVAGASLSLVSPSGSLIGRASSAPGLLSDSVSITVPIPQFAEAGTWDFGLVLLRDKAGNYRHVDPGDLGFPDSIEVVGLSDVTGPELVGVSVAGSPVDVSGSPGSVVVTFDVTDDLSGVAGASLSLVSPSGSLIGRASSAPGLLSDSVSITVPIPQFAEAGTWDFGLVLLRDKAGNYRHVDPGDLGFPDSIEVLPPMVPDAEPPTVFVDGDQVAVATDALGAVVTFPPPTATDDVAIQAGPTCDYASGDLFPVGTTTVTCSATDFAGKTGSASFEVIVDFVAGNAGPGQFLFKFGSYCNLATGDGCVDPDGAGPRQLGDGQFLHVVDVDVMSDGSIIASDTNGRIQRFTADGTFVETMFDFFAWGVAVGPNDEIVVQRNNGSWGGRIEIYDASGQFLHGFGSFGQGLGLDVDAAGLIYAVDSAGWTNRLRIFDQAGQEIGGIDGQPGQCSDGFYYPIDVAVAEDGRVALSVERCGLVQVYSAFPQLSHLATYDPGLRSAWGLDFDAQGTLGVVDASYRARMAFVDPLGEVVLIAGSWCRLVDSYLCVDPDGSGPLELGDGQFWGPVGLAIDRSIGRVVVPDRLNSRIQVFASVEDLVQSDLDGDGIDDPVDTDDVAASAAFFDGHTFGEILSAGANPILISDDPDPQNGVRIRTLSDNAGSPGEVEVCGRAVVSIGGFDDVTVTCGSVIVEVNRGQVGVVFEDIGGIQTILEIPERNSVTFTPETGEIVPAPGNPDFLLGLTDGASIVIPATSAEFVDEAAIDLSGLAGTSLDASLEAQSFLPVQVTVEAPSALIVSSSQSDDLGSFDVDVEIDIEDDAEVGIYAVDVFITDVASGELLDVAGMKVFVEERTPDRLVAEAIDVLEGALVGEEKVDKRAEKALERLRDSLDGRYWFDDSTLSDKGKKAFDDHEKAVKELEKAIEDGHPSAAALQTVVDLILEADQTLAEGAIAEARAAIDAVSGEDAKKAQKELDKAEDRLAKAQDELADGDLDKAIKEFAKVWEYAQKAVERQPVTGDMVEDGQSLAEGAIAEAQAAIDAVSGKDAKKAQKELDKAEDRLAMALDELADGDLERAIKEFHKAWEYAQKAIKKATRHEPA